MKWRATFWKKAMLPERQVNDSDVQVEKTIFWVLSITSLQNNGACDKPSWYGSSPEEGMAVNCQFSAKCTWAILKCAISAVAVSRPSLS